MRRVRLPPRYELLEGWAAVPWELLDELWRHTDGTDQYLVRRALGHVARLAIEEGLVEELGPPRLDRKLFVYAERREFGVYVDAASYEAAAAYIHALEDGGDTWPTASRVIGRSLELLLAEFDEPAARRVIGEKPRPTPPYHAPWIRPRPPADPVPEDEIHALFRRLAG